MKRKEKPTLSSRKVFEDFESQGRPGLIRLLQTTAFFENTEDTQCVFMTEERWRDFAKPPLLKGETFFPMPHDWQWEPSESPKESLDENPEEKPEENPKAITATNPCHPCTKYIASWVASPWAGKEAIAHYGEFYGFLWGSPSEDIERYRLKHEGLILRLILLRSLHDMDVIDAALGFSVEATPDGNGAMFLIATKEVFAHVARICATCDSHSEEWDTCLQRSRLIIDKFEKQFIAQKKQERNDA